MPRYLTLAIAALCVVISSARAGLADEYDGDAVERCFSHQSETLEATILMRLGKWLIEGAELGTVTAESGESWGYRVDFDGEVDGNALNLSLATLVEGDYQLRQGVWKLDGTTLRTDTTEFHEADCAPIKAWHGEVEKQDQIILAQSELVETVEDGEYCYARERDTIDVTVRLQIAQGYVSGGAFGEFVLGADATQEFWTTVQGSVDKNSLNVDLFTLINGQTTASQEVWTVAKADLITPTDTLVAVHCDQVREAYLARQPDALPPPDNVDVAALVAQFQQELTDFAGHLADCSAFDQDFRDIPNNRTLNRAVEGLEDGLCRVRFEAVDPEGRVLRCRLTSDQTATFAAGWVELANNIRPDGSYINSYPSDTPDGVRNIMSSDACQPEPL
ncbi:MAG: hypothetical protein AAGK37_10225 [Pseudomonadota bacterium]